MDLTAFDTTVSGVGFTLLGLWWVFVDKHQEWFADGTARLVAYAAVVLVAVVPDTAELVDLLPLQLEAMLLAVVLVLGPHAAWFFNHQPVRPEQ